MTPTEQIDLFAKNRDRADRGLADARESNNANLLALNYRQAFKAELMKGLLRWRHEIGNPRDDFERALAVASEAVENLRILEDPLWLSFPVALPSILGAVISKPASSVFTRHFPSPSAWSSCQSGIVREVSLALALIAPNQAPSLLMQIQQLKPSSKEQLAQETHELYLLLLSGAGTLEQADLLYRKRKKDGYYSGGEPYYGGGPENDSVVDFMLGAVIKVFGISSSSIHAWRWA